MRLQIKTVGGEQVEIDCDASLPRAVARAQIASALGFNEGEIALVHTGKILTEEGDDEPLSSTCLTEGALLVAVPRRGSPKATNPSTSCSSGSCAKSPFHTTGDEELARQMQIDEDEGVARKLQEDLDHNLARTEQAKQSRREVAPRLLFINGEFCAVGKSVPLLVDTGAQASVLTSKLVDKLGLSASIDRRFAGVVGGVGTARMLGRLVGISVRLGELTLSVDFQVLDSSQMPMQNLAILGLDQLAVHHMVVDMDRNVVLVGGCEGYAIRVLDPHEVPAEFQSNPLQQCCIQ